jgi:hypothetical protein
MLAKSLSREYFSWTFVLSLTTASAAAGADELQDLKTQVEALQKRLADDERASIATTPGEAVTAGATKGSFKLPGSQTSISLGGYVKLDAIFSDRSAGVGSTADQELEPANIPIGPSAGANERNQVKLHARQPRLFARTSAFGQTWTAFADVDAYPETVDFGGTVGQIFARQAQVRWTQPFAAGQWVIALENPETVASLPNGTAFRADDDRLPDLTSNVRFDTPFGRYTFAGLLRQVRVDSAADPASRSQKSGGALGVNAIVPFASKDDLRVSLYFGNAIGRYSAGYFSDGILTTSGQLQLPNQWIAAAAYRHFWTANLRSTLALSALATQSTADTAGAVNKNVQSAHLNLIWSPLAQTNFGIEYIHARRETHDGLSGHLNRVQTAAQYFF